jgi:hypothetical protein
MITGLAPAFYFAIASPFEQYTELKVITFIVSLLFSIGDSIFLLVLNSRPVSSAFYRALMPLPEPLDTGCDP